MPYKSKADRKRVSDAYYQAHTEEVKANTRLWRQRNPVNVFRNRIKRNAKRAGVAFDLDLNWFKERMEQGVCEATGLPFVDSDKPMAPFTQSVDRTDPGKGYTKDNCKMVIWIYNAAKGSNSHEDVMIMARSLCIQS